MTRKTIIGLAFLLAIVLLFVAGFRYMMSDKSPANMITGVRSIGPQPSR
ncbi:hypothetical protein [Sphingomonas sp.]|nr:hypothetical protein [Sphingomonas sp.]MBV9527895.1 hypothetical protein [Sphingomonas sp.]